MQKLSNVIISQSITLSRWIEALCYRIKRHYFPVITLGFAASLSAPASAAVVTSIKPLGFIAAAIADGVTPVEVLLPDGASEHDYALRPSDVKRLQGADLVVWIGPEMEAFISKTASAFPAEKNLELASLPTVKPLLITGAEEEDEHHDGDDDHHDAAHEHHHHGQYNMHLWMSPEIARQSAVAIHENYWNLCRIAKTNWTLTCSNLSHN